MGASEADLEVIRSVLQKRWPYPLSHDYRVDNSDLSKSDLWYFKVKRYPWAVSYGNKHVDKVIESAKDLLKVKGHAEVAESLPGPNNMDAESGKSIIVFLIKVSFEHIQYSLCDICSSFRDVS